MPLGRPLTPLVLTDEERLVLEGWCDPAPRPWRWRGAGRRDGGSASDALRLLPATWLAPTGAGAEHTNGKPKQGQ